MKLLTKRKIKKRKSRVKFVIFFLLLLTVFIFLLSSIFSYLNLKNGNFLNPVSGKVLNEETNIRSLLSSKHINFLDLHTNPDLSFAIKLNNEQTVIFSEKKDLISQISSLQLVLSRLTIEGKKFKILDFRFDNPVVSFN